MKLIYSKDIVVTEQHLDRNNHVNNVQYVHWVEEIAELHWDLMKNHTDYSNGLWVLIDHHIKYKKQAFLNDVITVRTYPCSPKGIRQPRRVEFYCHGELLAESDTLWIMIDGETKKTIRVKEDWLEDLLTQEQDNVNGKR